jgi:hypothetical protein
MCWRPDTSQHARRWLRAEIASSRTFTRTPAVIQAAASGVGEPTFIPSVTTLRGDPVLAAQADQLLADLGSHLTGNGPSLNNVKRGLVRSGWDLAPIVKTPWPQEHIVWLWITQLNNALF